MVVMILQNVPVGLRGELSRWMLEPRAGVFVGHITAMVRDLLWERCCDASEGGSIIQIWSTNTEQRFAMRVYGDPSRNVVQMEGLYLICRDHPLPDEVDDEEPYNPL